MTTSDGIMIHSDDATDRIRHLFPPEVEYGGARLRQSWRRRNWQSEQKFVQIDERKIAFVEFGAGSDLILLHGLGNSWEMWLPMLEALGDQYRVIAFDLPGFGDSDDLDAKGDGLAALARSIESAAVQLGVRNPAVVGHSLGGLVGAQLCSRGHLAPRSLVVVAGTLTTVLKLSRDPTAALRQPVEAAWLLLLATLVFPGVPATVRETILRLPPVAKIALSIAVRDATKLDRDLLRVALAGLRRPVWPTRIHDLFSRDITPILEAIEVPTLFLNGDSDRVIPLSDLSYFLEHVDGSQARVVHGGGHWVLLEYPELLLREIKEFLHSTD